MPWTRGMWRQWKLEQLVGCDHTISWDVYIRYAVLASVAVSTRFDLRGGRAEQLRLVSERMEAI